MVILGKIERDKFESQRELFSEEVQRIYDEATTYHNDNLTSSVDSNREQITYSRIGKAHELS